MYLQVEVKSTELEVLPLNKCVDFRSSDSRDRLILVVRSILEGVSMRDTELKMLISQSLT